MYILKGLYVITDQKLIPRDRFIETVEKAIRGGAKIIQLREKDTPEEEIIRLGKELLKITRRYGIPLIINDSPKLAMEIGADGVHLGKDDTEISEARKILGGEAIIGVSCYGDIERGLQAEKEGADYLAFGTPFFTPTKPDRKTTPFEILKEAKRRIKTIPIFAIGGITKGNAKSVLETGVDGIAVITAVFSSPNPEEAARNLADFFC
ncbi:MAG: thiamine-phosphate pyrophosphorylase, thiamine-phosphate pyrophosphorylase [Candidatus Dadabacteria bacterium CSP1-2]|nr:MAG: thiamine-phosphate pyrophosphorylase, thiamine-phosphate pyrophosphorylase [Candidatus Dadabacteria bacterium CSP1-2]